MRATNDTAEFPFKVVFFNCSVVLVLFCFCCFVFVACFYVFLCFILLGGGGGVPFFLFFSPMILGVSFFSKRLRLARVKKLPLS